MNKKNYEKEEQKIIFENEWKNLLMDLENEIDFKKVYNDSQEYMFQTFLQYVNDLRGGVFLSQMEEKIDQKSQERILSQEDTAQWFYEIEDQINNQNDNSKNILEFNENISKYEWNLFDGLELQDKFDFLYNSVGESYQNFSQYLNNRITNNTQDIQNKSNEYIEAYGLEISQNWEKYYQKNQLEQTPFIFSIKSLKKNTGIQFSNNNNVFKKKNLWLYFYNFIKNILKNFDQQNFIDFKKPYNMIKNFIAESTQVDRDIIKKVINYVREGVIGKLNEDLKNFGLSLNINSKSDFYFYGMWLLHLKYFEQQSSVIRKPLTNFINKKSKFQEYFLLQFDQNEKSQQMGKQLGDILYSKLKGILLNHLKDSFIKPKAKLLKENYNRIKFQTTIDQNLDNLHNTEQIEYITNAASYIKTQFNLRWGSELQLFTESVDKEFREAKDKIILDINKRIDKLKTLESDVENIFNIETGDQALNQQLIGQAALTYIHSYLKGKPEIPLKSDKFQIKNIIALPLDVTELDIIQQELFKNVNQEFKNGSITNINSFIDEFQKLLSVYLSEKDKNVLTLEEIDENGELSSYKDKIISCTAKCPCCERICDAADCSDDKKIIKHSCQLGHQLRAFNGFKIRETNEASVKFCYEMVDSDLILYKSKEYKWVEFKKEHPNWDFDFDKVNKEHEQRMRYLFLGIWKKIGKEICLKHDMKYVDYNTKPKAIRPDLLHYIICLDASNSMKNEWQNLLSGVQDFLQLRMDQCPRDFVSIIVFSDFAEIRVNSQLINPNLAKLRFMGFGTNFKLAFKQVYQIMEERKKQNHTQEKYQIVFMTDGVAADPTDEINKIMTNYGDRIFKSWVIPYGDESDENQLKNTFKNLNPQIKKVEDREELVVAFREIATEQ